MENIDVERFKNDTDWLPKLERFKDFRKTGRSYVLPFLFNCFFTFGYCSFYFVHHQEQINNIFLTIELLFLSISVISCWIVLAMYNVTDEVALTWRRRIKSILTLSISFFFSFHFLMEKRLFGSDHPTDNKPFDLPTSLILLIIVPFKAAEVFRETNDLILIFQLLIILGSLLIMVVLYTSPDTMIIFLSYSIMTILVRIDRYIFNWTVFDDLIEGKMKERSKEEANRELEKKIDNYTRTALERKISEMREIVGNVAHDLKTPLTSFMTATEMIDNDLHSFVITIKEMIATYENLLAQTDLSSKTPVGRFKQQVQDLYTKMLSSINSVRDINVFMLMMINRSLDFKKASTGICLVPLKETINLSTIISKPVKCLRNLQEKVSIQVNSSLNLYSYVRTDKLWLEENLLCVLSNAVKYSTMNTIELSISVVTAETLKKIAGRIEDDIVSDIDVLEPVDIAQITSEGLEIFQPQVSPNSLIREKRKNSNENPSIWRVSNLVKRPNCGHAAIHPKSELSDYNTFSTTISNFDDDGRNSPVSSTVHNRSNCQITDQQFVLFEIKDSGSRLPTEELKAFFNPFKQQRQSGGTGLGLYSLAKRVEALGGQYGVHEREDGLLGNVVWFTIPYDVDYECASDEGKVNGRDNLSPIQSDSETIKTVSPSSKSENPCILIVEDALSISRMTSMMLKRQQFRTEIAENGKIALEKVIYNYEQWKIGNGRRYDAILMDFQMPVMDGLEATLKIREYEKRESIRDELLIIGISAMSDNKRIEEALASGMNAFIPKPFTCKDFHDYLQNIASK